MAAPDEFKAYFATVALQRLLLQFGLTIDPPKAVLAIEQGFKERQELTEVGVNIWEDTEFGQQAAEVLNDYVTEQRDLIFGLCGEDVDGDEEDDLDFFTSDFEKWASEIKADGITTEETE